MRDVALTLPTHRACAPTLTEIAAEAAAAVAADPGLRVHLLVLDSSAPADRARHAAVLAEAVAALPAAHADRVPVHHLDEEAQRRFLRRAVDLAGLPDPEHVLELMLPDAVSYGACTNRAFLLAAALGCRSVHRRDSDSHYQTVPGGGPAHPLVPELAHLGRTAAEVAGAVTDDARRPGHDDRRVALVGASFIGDLSVDIAEIQDLDPEAYREVVGLWAPEGATRAERDALAEESFRGAGTEPFRADRTTLGAVDPMRVDMCNIAFTDEVFARVPLPPAVDTIGSDYFHTHLVHDAGLPGVLHNRHIVNFHTEERRTPQGFLGYQRRFVKFLLSMPYLNAAYAALAEAGDTLLDPAGRLRPDAVAALVREAADLPDGERQGARVLDLVADRYARLGDKYAAFAAALPAQAPELLARARADTHEFARLVDAWAALVAAAPRAAADTLVTAGTLATAQDRTPSPAPGRQPIGARA
ncbi:DUF6271 family protein (plasmid) [Streptomyces sp. BI20]|uniref:DUF6271 family protein n=1 Tax=Streptomyces sp. BI20 TaxID=3403460 RepID=UPI003C718FE7